MERLNGDSSEQREAEEWLLSALSNKLGVPLTKKRFELEEGSWLEIDGFSESPKVLCEAWAHIGAPRPAQKSKVMTDAIKLLYANTLSESDGELILLFADKEAASHFQGKSWMAHCLNKFNIEVEIIELPTELRNKVLEAQKRQYR